MAIGAHNDHHDFKVGEPEQAVTWSAFRLRAARTIAGLFLFHAQQLEVACDLSL